MIINKIPPSIISTPFLDIYDLLSKRLKVNRKFRINMTQQSKCPYCSSIFPNNEELSRHIDKIHNAAEPI